MPPPVGHTRTWGEGCWLHINDKEEGEFRSFLKEFRGTLTPGNYDHLDLTREVLREVTFPSGCSLVNATFNGAFLEKVRFQSCQVRGADFGRARLRNVSFIDDPKQGKGLDLTNANFGRARLEGCRFVGGTLDQSNFWRSSLELLQDGQDSIPCIFEECTLDESTFEASELNRVEFKNCRGLGVNFRNVQMTGIHFQGGNFQRSIFDDATLRVHEHGQGFTRDINLTSSDFKNTVFLPFERTGVVFEASSMAGVSFESAHLEYARFGEQSMAEGRPRNVRGADFTSANLTAATFYGVDLGASLLNASILRGTKFLSNGRDPCDLTNSRFESAVLEHVTFQACEARTCSFVRTKLEHVEFLQGTFQESSFYQAIFRGGRFGANRDPSETVDFTDCDFREAKFPGVVFNSGRFDRSNMAEADLTGILASFVPRTCSFVETILDRADLSGLRIEPQCNFSLASMREAKLVCAEIENVRFVGAVLDSSNLAGVKGFQADFRSADMREANLFGARLCKADFISTQLAGCYTIPLSLKNRRVNGEGSEAEYNLVRCVYDKWSQEPRQINGPLDLMEEVRHTSPSMNECWRLREVFRADFRDAHFENAGLQGSLFLGADFRRAFLDWANAQGANFRGAMLCGAKMPGADMSGGVFGAVRSEEEEPPNPLKWPLEPARICKLRATGASFEQASFRGCILRGADFSEARLDGVELGSARLENANFSRVSLVGVSDFDKIDLRPQEDQCPHCQSVPPGDAEMRGRFDGAHIGTTIGFRIKGRNDFDIGWDEFCDWLEGKDWSITRESYIAWKNNYASLGWYEEQSRCFIAEKVSEGRSAGWSWLHEASGPACWLRSVFFVSAFALFLLGGVSLYGAFFLMPRPLHEGHWWGFGLFGLGGMLLLAFSLLWYRPAARSLLLRALYDYGESPGKILGNAGFLILLYGLLYTFLDWIPWLEFELTGKIHKSCSPAPIFQFFKCFQPLYFSVVTFTTLGFGDITPNGFGRFLAASEALLGAIMIALFVFSLARRTAGR